MFPVDSDLNKSILKDAGEKGIKFIVLRFVDVFGIAKSCEIPLEKLEGVLESGLWFDGSSIEGFARIHESDMLLAPDVGTYKILPWTNGKVAQIVCDAFTPDGEPFEGDPRGILKKALAEAFGKGFEYKVGPELEYYLFKEKEGNGFTAEPEPHDVAGYFDLSPFDLATEVKREFVPLLQQMGLDVEMSHHECGPGQHEIDFKYGDALTAADSVINCKHVLKIVARKHCCTCSFMPKPVFGIAGNAMHTHQSLWKNGKNVFFDDNDEYKISKEAYGFIAGQLKHARGLSAILSPTVNSYKRLVAGYEAPINICWARLNRSSLIRVPAFRGKESAARAELRCPDPSCNPYLAFAVMLAAGLDGIEKNLVPPEPVEENVYLFNEEELREKNIDLLPQSLDEALDELEKDEVVKRVLGKHVFETILAAQREKYKDYRMQVTPWELKEYLPTI